MQETALMSHFRTNLKQLMLQKSVEIGNPLNRSDIATATGLSLPTISRWYNGKVDSLESKTVEKLTEFFDCKFADLVEYVADEE